MRVLITDILEGLLEWISGAMLQQSLSDNIVATLVVLSERLFRYRCR